MLERVGLDPKLADRYPAQLSGGQQQRVGVARALAADPPILLMDEPFSAVDPVVREELQTEILRLQSELRKTIVFVTHDIDEAVKLGDKVAVFGRGGALQQYDATRSSCCRTRPTISSPGFVGADRGYRGLQFFHATGLPLHDVRTVGEAGIDALDLGPGRVGAGHQARRHAVRVDQRRRRRRPPQGQLVVRQHHRRRVAVPARRHAAAGARRGAVLTGGARGGGRRGRAGDRRGAAPTTCCELLDEQRRIPEVG